jgi:hypothetical protein
MDITLESCSAADDGGWAVGVKPGEPPHLPSPSVAHSAPATPGPPVTGETIANAGSKRHESHQVLAASADRQRPGRGRHSTATPKG